MIVYLDEKEICTALVEYIANQGYPVQNKKVDVTLIAGRGKNGHSAQLSFEATSSKVPSSDEPVIDPDDRQQAIMFEFQNPDKS